MDGDDQSLWLLVEIEEKRYLFITNYEQKELVKEEQSNLYLMNIKIRLTRTSSKVERLERDRIYMEFPMSYLKLSPNALEDAFVLKLDGWGDEYRGIYQRL